MLRHLNLNFLFPSVADLGGQYKVIILIWKSLWFLCLIPLLWILYCILKKLKSPFLCKKMNILKSPPNIQINPCCPSYVILFFFSR